MWGSTGSFSVSANEMISENFSFYFWCACFPVSMRQPNSKPRPACRCGFLSPVCTDFQRREGWTRQAHWKIFHQTHLMSATCRLQLQASEAVRCQPNQVLVTWSRNQSRARFMIRRSHSLLPLTFFPLACKRHASRHHTPRRMIYGRWDFRKDSRPTHSPRPLTTSAPTAHVHDCRCGLTSRYVHAAHRRVAALRKCAMPRWRISHQDHNSSCASSKQSSAPAFVSPHATASEQER